MGAAIAAGVEAGAAQPEDGRRREPRLWLPARGAGSLLQQLRIEAFLGDLGCGAAPPDCLDAKSLAGAVIGQRLWEALATSAFLRRHVTRILRKCSQWLCDLKVAPGPGRPPERVRDFFLRSAFEPLVGPGALPFVEVPEVCAPLLASLQIPWQTDVDSLAKAMTKWATQSPLPLSAPDRLCRALLKAAQGTVERPAALASLHKLIFVPGQGVLEASAVVWSTEGALLEGVCSFLGVPVLRKFYAEDLQEWFCKWLGVCEAPGLPHLIKTLAHVGTGPPEGAAQSELLARAPRRDVRATLSFVRQVYERLAWEAREPVTASPSAPNADGDPAEKRRRLDTRWKADVVQHIAHAFRHMRLVVLPQPNDRPWKFVRAPDAFWQVEESLATLPCSFWALQNFYAAGRALGEEERLDLCDFFTQVAGVPLLLTREQLQERCQPPPATSSRGRPTRPSSGGQDAGGLESSNFGGGSGLGGASGRSGGTAAGGVRTQQEDDSLGLGLSDLLGDDPFVLREFLSGAAPGPTGPQSAGGSGAASTGGAGARGGKRQDDAAAEEAALGAQVAHCTQLMKSADPGDVFFDSSSSSARAPAPSGPAEQVAIRRVDGWSHKGVRLYVFGVSAALFAPKELKRWGLEAPRGPRGGLVASRSLATRAAAFADIVLLPLADVFQVPRGTIAAAVGPGAGRGRSVRGLVCLGLSRFQTSEGREERCRWFAEVCRLLAEAAPSSGGPAFSSAEVAAALTARHLPRLMDLEGSGGTEDDSSGEEAQRVA